MIDMHYDILSILYNCYLRNDFSYIDLISKNFNSNNVNSVIANLYFMNEEEMKEEFGNYYIGSINVLEMFRISTDLFKKYFPNIKVIFSIEGCDYIKDTKELEELYKLELRSILLVWCNPNKYGSGTRGDYGLTELGKKLLIKAIDLGICIDLSHMNIKTFYDTVDLLREQKQLGKDVKVIVSHSNCYNVYNNLRNISDEQIKAIKEFNPIMGLVSYEPFIYNSNDKNILLDKYLEHIDRVVAILGISNVGVATDDMSFTNFLFGDTSDEGLFNYKNVRENLTKLLRKKYNKDEVEKILYQNIFNKLF